MRVGGLLITIIGKYKTTKSILVCRFWGTSRNAKERLSYLVSVQRGTT